MTTDPRPSPAARLLLVLVGLYQRTALLRSPRCRFHPTCSSYALEAIARHGALRGSWLAVRRIGRCHPFHPGGVDHVPGHDEAHLDTTTSPDAAPTDAAVA